MGKNLIGSRIQAKLLGFKDQVLIPSNEALRESIFTVRSFFHELFGGESKPKTAYPPVYDAIRQFTHLIQEDRAARKALKKASHISLHYPIHA